jgi:hypothetical protein
VQGRRRQAEQDLQGRLQRQSDSLRLDKLTQGPLSVSVRFGAGEPQCITLGGTIIRNVGTTNPGPSGAYIAKNSVPSLGTCPTP